LFFSEKLFSKFFICFSSSEYFYLTCLYPSIIMPVPSRSRVYPDININKPREYWDYECHQIG